MVEGRLANLLGRSSGYIESLPVAVRHRVDGLQGLQVEQSKIEAEFQAEILELEKKYAKRYAPLFDQRAAIINGKQEPSDQLVDEGRKADQDDDDDDDQSDDEHAAAQPAAADRPKPTPAELESGPKVSAAVLSHSVMKPVAQQKLFLFPPNPGHPRVLGHSAQEPRRHLRHHHRARRGAAQAPRRPPHRIPRRPKGLQAAL